MTAEPSRRRRILHRTELLRAVADHIRDDGLRGFTLRRAAAAAGTTHKVLLYHFGSAENLITEAVDLVRADMVIRGRAAVRTTGAGFAERLDALWAHWRAADGGSRVLYEAIGLAMAHPEQFGDLAKRATEDVLAQMSRALAPVVGEDAADTVATLMLALLRGLTIDRSVTGDDPRVDAAFGAFAAALTGALDPAAR
jgi:AcrR family transcriptional regulator